MRAPVLQTPRSLRSLVGMISALFALAVAPASCGGGQNASSPSGRALPAYAGRAADLFDDAIEPAAVGLDFDKGYTPRGDPALRERAQVGDAVLRVRVTTVTAKTDGPTATYELGLNTVEKLCGEHPPNGSFTVQISRSSGSHGIMKNFENRLVGYPFIAFVREFVRSDGDREVHFHLAPDTKDVRSAVGDSILMSSSMK